MLARACRVLPGVLVTMCLAGPFMAPQAQASQESPTGERVPKPRSHTHHASTPSPRLGAGTSADHAAARSHALRHGLREARAHHREPYRVPHHATVAFLDDSIAASPGTAGWRQSGMASWYGGRRWQGNRTSSGGRYDENALTAAHASLPLGSKVLVALHDSDRTVVVTITDRPGTRSRIIDLSRGAASALGILERGVAMVTLSPM